MRRNELEELHYITTISNVPSIMTRGILSHKRSKKINHNSVAMEVIQERRGKSRQRGKPLTQDKPYFENLVSSIKKCIIK